MGPPQTGVGGSAGKGPGRAFPKGPLEELEVVAPSRACRKQCGQPFMKVEPLIPSWTPAGHDPSIPLSPLPALEMVV